MARRNKDCILMYIDVLLIVLMLSAQRFHASQHNNRQHHFHWRIRLHCSCLRRRLHLWVEHSIRSRVAIARNDMLIVCCRRLGFWWRRSQSFEDHGAARWWQEAHQQVLHPPRPRVGTLASNAHQSCRPLCFDITYSSNPFRKKNRSPTVSLASSANTLSAIMRVVSPQWL
jgi:hypothetical protein